MTSKYLKTLEFDKIINMACEFAVCKETKMRLLGEESAKTAYDATEKLALTDALVTLLVKQGSPRFSGVDGVENAVKRAVKGGILSMAELLSVGHTLRNFSNLIAWYGSAQSEELPTDELFYSITSQPTLEKHIFACILSETEMADTASDTLYDLRRKIRASENSIRDKLDGLIKSQNTSKYLQETVVSLRNGRYVVPVKAENKGDIAGVIHDVSSSGATLFVEPAAVVQANAKIMQLKSQETEEIDRILGAMSDSVASLEPMFSHSFGAMLEIDTILAKAHLALSQNAMKPTVNDSQIFNLIRARHPLIQSEKAVPIDLSLGDEYDALIITGPNTGGKTVSLKTAGLLCVMAAHGYLIPAHETSSVCIFDEVLADIGDEQSIEQSLSTFSGHIKNITEILDKANAKTLVLLDELGAGTDPGEGAALAVAIIEKLRSSGTKLMATTHYAELKIFALDTERVQNAGCEFDIETLRPTYKIRLGVPGRSSAFLISEKLGLPQDIIQNASVHLSNDDRRLNSVLTQLENMKIELKNDKEEIARLNDVAKIELEKAEKQRQSLIKQGETELAAAREKANKLSTEVQTSAYALLDELRKMEKADKKSAAQRAVRAREIARKDSEKLFIKNDTSDIDRGTYKPVTDIKVGMEVYIISLGLQGAVQNLPDKKNMVEVRAGAIKTKVALSDLGQVKKAPPAQASKYAKRNVRQNAHSTASSSVRNASMEINLIGMTVHEALHEADKFIDGCVMCNMSTVYLIHGKGEGILRKAIHEHLRTHRSIKSYRLGTFGEGEAGVTVVELK